MARTGHPQRPNLLRLFLYSYWVPLPARYREWVLFDTTTRTWVLRHVLRTLVAVAVPVAAVAVFLPASGGIRALTAFTTGACAVMFVTLYINEATEHRLVQAGFPWGTGEHARARRAERDEIEAARRRRARLEKAWLRRHGRA